MPTKDRRSISVKGTTYRHLRAEVQPRTRGSISDFIEQAIAEKCERDGLPPPPAKVRDLQPETKPARARKALPLTPPGQPDDRRLASRRDLCTELHIPPAHATKALSALVAAGHVTEHGGALYGATDEALRRVKVGRVPLLDMQGRILHALAKTPAHLVHMRAPLPPKPAAPAAERSLPRSMQAGERVPARGPERRGDPMLL